MKKIILTAIVLSAVITGCKESRQQEGGTSGAVEVVHQDQAEHSGEATALNNAWVNEIRLNDGKKWEANLETTQGVESMLELLKTSDPKSVEDYHHLAADLNDEKDFVVRECTMEGPSHDNLHVFLHPLIEKIDALSKVSTGGEGADLTAGIKENLDGYYAYFK